MPRTLTKLFVFGVSIMMFAVRSGAGGLTVHEWGTFTSVQGGDGALQPWQPLVTSRLPAFVHTWANPGPDTTLSNLPGFGGKYTLTGLQRLETPVVYFYGANAQQVDLSVDFPHGWITEWYPHADSLGRNTAQQGGIQWHNLQLLPANASPELAHPDVDEKNRYYAARATDANLVKSRDETEKFLFYRGLGNFATPLRVTMKSDFSLTVSNTGLETLPALFVLEKNDTAGSFVAVPPLQAGETRDVVAPLAQKLAFTSDEELTRVLSGRFAEALVHAGLYPREAEAMVKTWQDSWFQETGLRVMYILPRPWTDRVLPMRVRPAPDHLVRVMVGRAEVLTPRALKQLGLELSGAKDGSPEASAKLRQTLKELGRFAAPAFNRAIASLPDLKPDDRVRLYAMLSVSAHE
jgi:hypothetical protein